MIRDGEEKLSIASVKHDDRNSMHHEHMGVADESPNTPEPDEAD